MRASSKIKRTIAAVAAVSALALGSLPSKAFALGFPFGDLAFVVYGGGTERYENFGTGSSFLTLESTSITTRDIGGDLATLNAGAPVGLRYTILGTGTDFQTFYVSSAVSTLTPGILTNTFGSGANETFVSWSFQHAAATGGDTANNPSFTLASAAHSFTTAMGPTGTLNGQLGFASHALPGQELSIFHVNLQGGPGAEIYTRVATALLSENGLLTITPTAVPVPAAVVLFGTGLIGLVGIARRSMGNRQAA